MAIGIDDPRAWLDATPDDVVTLWEAFYQLEPWGGEYRRHADEMEILDATFALHANMNIPKNRRDLRYTPRKRKQFFPVDYAGEYPVTEKKNTSVFEQCEQYAKTVMSQIRK